VEKYLLGAQHPLRSNTVVVSLLAVSLLIGCGKDVAAPPYGVNAAAAENHGSDLSAVIRFDYQTLASTMEQSLPKQMRSNVVLADCTATLAANCEGLTGKIDLNRTGAVQISKSSRDGAFDVIVPLAINGEVNGPTLAAPTRVDLQARLKMAVSADIGTDWCPNLKTNNEYVWEQPARIELPTGATVNLAAQQGGLLSELDAAISDLLQRQINCTEIRSRAEKIWAKRSVPVDVPKLGTMHLRVDPQRIQLSESVVQDQALDFSFLLGGQLKLDKTEQPTQQQNLPDLARTDALDGSQLKVQLPVTLDYALITKEITALIEERSKIKISTDVGTAQITFGQVRSYPSFNDLAIAIQFNADMPSPLPNTNGAVYILVTPTVDADGKTLRMTNLRSSTSLSNDLYQSLDLELSKSVKKRVEKYLTFEVETYTGKLTQILNEELAQQQEGLSFQVELQYADFKLGKATLREEGMVVLAQFSTLPTATAMAKRKK
jgi:hypothetical protein